MSGGEAVIRRARSEDVEPILDLLAHYERRRSYFEPFYLKDPSYRPGQSWVAEEDGRLVAHIRVFDREIRAELRVADLGNLITAPDQRGRGHAGRLLEAILAEIPGEGFPYSLLRAYRPVFYERYGWATIDQDLVRATLPSSGDAPTAIERFVDEDLPEIMRLYDERRSERNRRSAHPSTGARSSNGWTRTGTASWSHGGDGALAGYVRSRAEEGAVAILELELGTDETEVRRALLTTAASLRGGQLQAFLPPSLRALFRSQETEVTNEFGMMGRVLDLAVLAATLEPVWIRRARESGARGGPCTTLLAPDAPRCG